MIWALGALAFIALWFVLFLAAALIDEDVNHWNWPTETGPGLLAHLRMLALSGAVAGVVVGLPVWLLVR